MTFFLPLSPLGDLLEHMIEGPVGQLHQQLNLLLAQTSSRGKFHLARIDEWIACQGVHRRLEKSW